MLNTKKLDKEREGESDVLFSKLAPSRYIALQLSQFSVRKTHKRTHMCTFKGREIALDIRLLNGKHHQGSQCCMV